MITLMPKQSIVVRRYGMASVSSPVTGGRYERGKWIEDNPAAPDFTIMVSVQPANGNDMVTYGEGRRVKSMYRVFASVEVFTTDPQYAMNPALAKQRDEIIYNNEIFEVVHVEPWKNGILPHYEFLMLRELETYTPITATEADA